MIPLMPRTFIVIPSTAASLVLVACVVLGAIVERRQHYIARPAIFANAVLLWQVFFDDWGTLPAWLQTYLNVGSLVGVLAVVSYLWRFKLPSGFYRFSLYTYGSFTILVLVVGLADSWSLWR